MNTDEHQPQTENGQNIAKGKRQDIERPPFKIIKDGRLTARELSRRRRQRLQELIQRQAN